MILTVTMNPSVDISYPLTVLDINSVNRVSSVSKEAGGKGLNVARVIKLAGRAVLATGISGGILGEYILSQLTAENIAHDFYPVAGESRNCIAILHQGWQTEILEPGPAIGMAEQQQFLEHFNTLLDRATTVTLSGSLPVGIAKNYYSHLIQRANRKNKKVLLDCAGESLHDVINGEDLPWLIKPNQQEIEQLTGKELDCTAIDSFKAMVDGHRGLQRIPWLIVSLGKSGAFARINGRYYRVTVPEINAVNPVGSGDATIAGLAMAINDNKPAGYALKQAMTLGILNAMQPKTGWINIDDFSPVMKEITVRACH